MADTQSSWYSSSASAEWYTEANIIRRVITTLGHIDLDPCSNAPPYNVPAILHMSRTDGGLNQRWHGKVYMNPPYGRGATLPRWISKLAYELRSKRVTEAITLTPARTETVWFQHLWQADALCFWRGRLHFAPLVQDGPLYNAPFPSVLAYFGKNPRRFANAFEECGKVIYPNEPGR